MEREEESPSPPLLLLVPISPLQICNKNTNRKRLGTSQPKYPCSRTTNRFLRVFFSAGPRKLLLRGRGRESVVLSLPYLLLKIQMKCLKDFPSATETDLLFASQFSGYAGFFSQFCVHLYDFFQDHPSL